MPRSARLLGRAAEALHAAREWGRERAALATGWVKASEIACRAMRRWGQRGCAAWWRPCGVAEDGVAVVGEVDADLVAAAGFEADFDGGGVGQRLEDAIVRDRELAFVGVARGVLVEIAGGGQVRAKRAGGGRDGAGHDGDVGALGLALLELFLQRLEHRLATLRTRAGR